MSKSRPRFHRLKSVGTVVLAILGIYVVLAVVRLVIAPLLDFRVPLLDMVMGPGYFIVAYWIGMALLVRWVADQKGRSRRDWFVLGLLYSFIPLIALAALPNVSAAEDTSRAD